MTAFSYSSMTVRNAGPSPARPLPGSTARRDQSADPCRFTARAGASEDAELTDLRVEGSYVAAVDDLAQVGGTDDQQHQVVGGSRLLTRSHTRLKVAAAALAMSMLLSLQLI